MWLIATIFSLAAHAQSSISAQATRVVSLVLLWLPHACRDTTGQNVEQVEKRQMRQSPLLLPCPFSGLYLLYNLAFSDRCFCFLHIPWSIRFISRARLNLQIAAVLLATGGAALSVMHFDNSFSNSHQRVGLALYGSMWLQPLIGFFRPERWKKY